MNRYCFQLQVRPEHVAEYTARHAEVWPEMLRALADAGWHNYSLFLREDGLLTGYVEAPSLSVAQEAMERTEVNSRWQTEMAPYFADLGVDRPDTGFRVLPEIFHLEDQLHALPHRSDED